MLASGYKLSCWFLIRRWQVRLLPAEYAEQAKATVAGLIGVSALLTTTMPDTAKTLKALTDAGATAKIITGKTPVTRDYADRTGADGYYVDSAAAVDLAKRSIAKVYKVTEFRGAGCI
jgi:methanogenic corrinoid protein MtbC1